MRLQPNDVLGNSGGVREIVGPRSDMNAASASGTPMESGEATLPDSITRIVATSLFLLVSWTLASRQLHTAPDDVSYLLHFLGFHGRPSDPTWWEYLVTEPLWAPLCSISGHALGPELAMRVTIFLSSFGLLWSANRLCKGAWAFVLLVFVVSEPLATQLYFNQIRQGVALTLFLVGLSVRPRLGVLSAGLGVTVHTSFLAVLLAMMLSVVTRKLRTRSVLLLSAVAVIAAIFVRPVLSPELFAQAFASHGEGYAVVESLQGGLNLNFYVVSLFAFGVVMYSVRELAKSDYLLWRFTWLLYGLALISSFYHPSGGRIFYLFSILYPILIARAFPRKPSIHVIFLGFVVGYSVWNHLRFAEYYSVFEIWDLILYGSR